MHALGDKNKDGDLSQSELESLVHSVQDRNFRVIDLLGSKSYSIQAIPMPDVILEIGNNTNGMELENFVLLFYFMVSGSAAAK